MFPPSQAIDVDVDAISGICGSISIACWIVVFSPQIAENFKRRSADGLSIVFIIIWLSGDIFNILGAVLQGVLPTMIILAVYYTLADIVLLGQCFYYKGFTLRDDATTTTTPIKQTDDTEDPHEGTGLLQSHDDSRDYSSGLEHSQSDMTYTERSSSTVGDGNSGASSPALSPRKKSHVKTDNAEGQNVLIGLVYNVVAVVLVCGAGVVGWWLSYRASSHPGSNSESPVQSQEKRLQFNVWGQIFGYVCAALYLGSRVPQLLLNYRRKSTEGISLLFFLFACIGNLTYVFSIIAYTPVCKNPSDCAPGESLSIYGKYMLINLSWLFGSAGTLVLDASVFVQFFMYRKKTQ